MLVEPQLCKVSHWQSLMSVMDVVRSLELIFNMLP